ncbi:uncharacterized protein LOC135120474 [Zophobas morio]|uniref:uncharacterized protein LOC135120474 n=1 Tax=Zophobas morio TaxID=2755281 RepID=UPI00308299CB
MLCYFKKTNGSKLVWFREQTKANITFLVIRNYSLKCDLKTIHSCDNGKISSKLFHDLSDNSLKKLTSFFENFIEQNEEKDWDVYYESGVLTVNLGQYGTYVINKQAPNKQLWLSSPLGGPKRYDYNTKSKEWISLRDGSKIKDVLSTELSIITKKKIELPSSIDGE